MSRQSFWQLHKSRGDSPNYQPPPIQADPTNDPVMARWRWYWSLSPEERAMVDRGENPELPQRRKRP